MDREGDLLTCEEYERLRGDALEGMLKTAPLSLTSGDEYELVSYLDYILPWTCDREAEEYLLANLPEKLLPYIEKLKQTLHPEVYSVGVRVCPLGQRRIIEVTRLQNPGWTQLLYDGRDVVDFLKWYRAEGATYDDETRTKEEDEAREVATPSTDSSDHDAQADLMVGLYSVNFDELGATFEHGETQQLYRINAPTANTALGLLEKHPDIVIAMTRDRPEMIEQYALGSPQSDEPDRPGEKIQQEVT